jgi:hypothetical protein
VAVEEDDGATKMLDGGENRADQHRILNEGALGGRDEDDICDERIGDGGDSFEADSNNTVEEVEQVTRATVFGMKISGKSVGLNGSEAVAADVIWKIYSVAHIANKGAEAGEVLDVIAVYAYTMKWVLGQLRTEREGQRSHKRGKWRELTSVRQYGHELAMFRVHK